MNNNNNNNNNNNITYIDETDMKYNKLSKHYVNKLNSITFNNITYLDEIIKSYSSISSIYNQFGLDCNRTHIEVNNNIITNIEEFTEHVGWLDKYKINFGKIRDLFEYILLMTLQSSYAFPYVLLHNIYCTDDNNLILSSTSSNRNIYITTNTEYINILIECDLEIKNYITGKTIKKINVTIYLKLKDKLINFNIKNTNSIHNIIDNKGLLVWKILND
jgi:hypothetical protein